jgi:hypothetical protein
MLQSQRGLGFSALNFLISQDDGYTKKRQEYKKEFLPRLALHANMPGGLGSTRLVSIIILGRLDSDLGSLTVCRGARRLRASP